MGGVVGITGASAGVGRATAHAFARQGAAVALLARGRERLDAAGREVEELGGRALTVPLDVADAQAVENAAARIEEELGPIDVWVNNAMVSVFSPSWEMSPDEFRRVTEVTYLGYVYGTMAALKRMKRRDWGTIVQVGSALSYRAIPLQSAYCGAKHAINGFTESVRSELIHEGSKVHITMVQLPGLNTPQFEWVKNRLPGRPQPVPPIYQPEVAAEAIYWAAHHHRREVVVGGSALQAIVGDKAAPGALDHYVAGKAWEGQYESTMAEHDRSENLWEPPPGDYGTHGRFDDRSYSRSYLLWADLHRAWLAAAGLAAGFWLASRRLFSR
jgi:NAD(P)-dependent dehydrogenase (short-subunit alcohol dehydrogenase family)